MNEVINLIQVIEVPDDLGGFDYEIESEAEVFAEKKSVSQKEFYLAMQSGLETVAVFAVWFEDYNDERVIEHEEDFYTVTRTFRKGDKIHLTCTKRHGVFEEIK